MNCLESTGTLHNSSPLIDPDLFYRYIDLMTNHLGSKISRKRKSLGRIRIQDAVLHIFQRRPLPYSYYTLQSNLRRLIRTDTGPIIYDYFKDQLLKKGMVILRESMKNLKGVALLEKLSETWNYFYKEIIFTLQAILYPFQDNSTEEMPMTIRQVILADFRDTVLLKINQDVEGI
ncbi:proline-rich protein 5-like isoform X2 [Octopus bimaculoides]|uniref:Cullin N-terminal domain-containing protein n=1 Tax=Octopus bimaculoides TaxID=37653 RepID=A0A0L8FJ65_OCTBM|nr:proline-rich protein 5-like isoform X2 [Octopus bimaculoides]|eukprot:XP_014789329.1 PREDICTED: proline-rich protein 5-like [Octopus bimaculoides]